MIWYWVNQQLSNERKKVFVPVVKSKLRFFEVEMKVLAGNASVVVEPSLGVGEEEAFNTIDVSSPANVLIFAVQDPLMSSSKGENSISLKVIGVVDTAPFGMFQDKRHESGSSSVGHREGDDFTVSLIHPKYQFLSFKLLKPLLPFFLPPKRDSSSSSSPERDSIS